MPQIVSLTVTPQSHAPCTGGLIDATVSWKVTPATATVVIRSMDGKDAPKEGPFPSEGSAPVPPVPCDKRTHGLELDATNGGGKFAGMTSPGFSTGT